MKLMLKKTLFWILAVIITLGASVYQRMTGPTHPKILKTEIDGVGYSFKFPRSGGETDCPVVLENVPSDMEASLFWKKYPSEEDYTESGMVRNGRNLTALLPMQPPAGKLEYYLVITQNMEGADTVSRTTRIYFKDDPLVIRFKGEVPAWLLIPHILFMFVSMLFAAYAFLCAAANMQQYKRYIVWAFWILLIGGFILGPLVQRYAFGVYWSGFPLGGDLTDNKTLFAMLALLCAVITRKFSWNRAVSIAAVLVMFVVFSIPHSLRGSQLDHTTGEVITADK